MKVLHLNTFDIRGGAARAAYRIHQSLKATGVCSSMLVANKYGDDDDVDVYPVHWQERKMKWSKRMLSWQGSENPTYHSCNLFPSGICRVINHSDNDIIHLHWLGNEFINIAEIAKINKPIVWTLHDMWAFSGAEHYEDVGNPGRFREGYKKSNRPAGHAGIFDCDAWVWRRKKKHWSKTKFNFVTPSRWLGNCLEDSALLGDHAGTVIPYPINTAIFRPHDKMSAREYFTLPEDKKMILFGADSGTNNPLKGYDYLKRAIGRLSTRTIAESCQIVIFGGKKKSNIDELHSIPVTDVGHLTDDGLLAMLYSAADVFVLPSIIDNLPQTMIEALSCGTPGVGFKIGGVPDMIVHNENGYLAEPFEAKDLANGIEWVLSYSEEKCLGIKARLNVERENSNELIGGKYIKLYESILSSGQFEQSSYQ